MKHEEKDLLNGFIEFLKKLLTKDPNKRATVRELTTDSWLTDGDRNPLDIFEPSMTNESISQTYSTKDLGDYKNFLSCLTNII